MKKIFVLVCLLALSASGFSEQLLTSLKNGVVLNNRQETAYQEGTSFFYLVQDTDLQLYKTQGVFYVADYYKRLNFISNVTAPDYDGALAFAFVPVSTEQGPAIKISTKVLNRSGLDLRGATITAAESASGLTITFKVQRCERKEKPASKVFQVLVPSQAAGLSAQELSAIAAKNIRLALANK